MAVRLLVRPHLLRGRKKGARRRVQQGKGQADIGYGDLIKGQSVEKTQSALSAVEGKRHHLQTSTLSLYTLLAFAHLGFLNGLDSRSYRYPF